MKEWEEHSRQRGQCGWDHEGAKGLAHSRVGRRLGPEHKGQREKVGRSI